METMNVTRALATLKQLDDKIARGIASGLFVSITVGKNQQQKMYDGVSTVDATKAKIQSSFDSLNSMFAQRTKIKAAIVLSNANTTVTLLGKTMTVAEAIELKSSIANKQTLLNMLKNQYTNSVAKVNTLNTKLEETIELNLKTIYGADKAKVDPSAYDTISKPQKDGKEAALLDTMNIEKQIQVLEEEVSAVTTELDYVLSTANAKTEISI